MAKQTIEIEVPDGKRAVWKDGKVCFEPVNPMELIKTVEDAARYLAENNLCPELLLELSETVDGTYGQALCEYRVVVAALTNNEQRHLTTGERWFPVVQFCRPKDIKNCFGKKLLGYIESEGEKYAVVGGHAHNGANAGLGNFFSNGGVSGSWANVGFRSVSSKEVAEYISSQFGQLLFQVHYGGVNCDWRWV